MLHELIFALHGFPGDLCAQLPVADLSSTSDQYLKLLSDRLPFVAPSEIALVSQLLRVGDEYFRLQKFVQQFSLTSSGSLYLTALAYGVDDILEKYRGTLRSIEEDLLNDPYVGITHIFSRIEPFRAVLSSLILLLDRSIKHNQENTNPIDSLCRLPDQPSRRVIQRYLMRVFRHQLSSWLLYGTLYDPYNEFCVTNEFTLAAEKFPSILSPTLANEILYTGKAVHAAGTNLSNQLDARFSKEFSQLESIEEDNEERLERLIRDISRFVSGEVSRRMFDECGLVENITLVKDVLLLGRGELFVAFLDNLAAEGSGSGRDLLDRPVPSSLGEARGISHAVNFAFMAAARAVGMDDETLSGSFK